MKKILLTVALVGMCVGAFAQGKITMGNNAQHLVYFSNAVKPADSALALTGLPASNVPTPSGATFLIELWGAAGAGQPVGSMTLQTSVGLNGLAGGGGFGNVNFTSGNLPGGSTSTFIIKVRETAFATAELAQANGGYFGYSQVFQMNPSSTIAFNSIVNAGGTALSTWANGTQVLPNGLGAIAVGVVPEPSSMALAGLGAASLLIFRRRK
jgi:hypothetical protein